MIFLDTSAIYALADRADARHGEARRLFDAVLAAREELVTHNYVLVESLALIQHRLGGGAAGKLVRSSANFEIVWIDAAVHDEAGRRFTRASSRRVSFVDEVSFLVMESRGIGTAFAFDPDFARRGFKILHS